ncbi:MAG: hypothetical protein SFV52_07640 [Saprospiraceae bacterium]|nr:hypothetical protein [Saprospiraceae bacterium]
MDPFRAFIDAHLQENDLTRLLLRADRFPGIDVSRAVRHIHAIRKLTAKAPAWARSDLAFSDLLSVEQASSEATALFKAGLFSGRRMADLTGGLGMDAWAFSRRFAQVDYVEPDWDRARDARHNFEVLGAPNITVHTATAAQFLAEAADDAFDLVYLDPSRRDEHDNRVFRFQDCSPNVVELLDRLLAVSPGVLVKAAPMLDIREARRQLPGVSRVWVVSVRGEVREVLYLLTREHTEERVVALEAVLLGGKRQGFRFTAEEESSSAAGFGPPGRWLYDPDAAVLKAGAFKCVAARFGLTKLGADTHLYTSDVPADGFPGRRFLVTAVVRMDKKDVLAALSEPRGNVAVRHFPMAAEAVRRRLGLADGGEDYLFAATLADGSRRVIVGRKA